MKILLLEDDHLLNDAITKYIKTLGHIVANFRNGDDAYEAIKTNSFDLLILDINVPGLDGFALLEEVHKLKIQIPTIYISALADIEDISHAFDLGCHDYLKKPFHLKELTIRIDKILQSRYVPQMHLRLSTNYSFDMESSTLRFDNEVQILPKRQLQIIKLLTQNRSQVVSYDMFFEYVWNNTEIDIPTIRAEINRLKKVLKEDFIVNIRSIGYMIKRPI
jgi:DNA-binding response OmpR family regulator